MSTITVALCVWHFRGTSAPIYAPGHFIRRSISIRVLIILVSKAHGLFSDVELHPRLNRAARPGIISYWCSIAIYIYMPEIYSILRYKGLNK